ncbi:hypothetical protein SAMN04489806_2933 [Paramicrobacterium humi]|uniref:Uncharacterized protein n=1 Tax=Paramicrobacterium humi TaxID=640635 RepID=A0A1H4QWA3_9MICO|nr:hypothetical protein SAMN04489806_2933 [Microbacterium humi]
MLAVISVLLVGVVTFLFDVVAGDLAGTIAGGLAFVVAAAVWILVWRTGRHSRRRHAEG